MKCLLIVLILLPASLIAQSLTEHSRQVAQLKCGETIIMFASRDCATCYYYLPVNFVVARKKDNTPEVSLVTWKNDENSKVVGGILHFLVSWGISLEDENFIISGLRRDMDSLAVVMGPVNVLPAGSPEFQGDDGLAQVLSAHLNSIPPASTTPGAKMAFSFRFDEEGIEKLMQYVSKPSKTTTKLVIPYTYELLTGYGDIHIAHMQVELKLGEVLKYIR